MKKIPESKTNVPDATLQDAPPPGLRIYNPNRKGQSVFAASSVPVVFDNEGYAHAVCDQDREILLSVPGYMPA